MVDTPVQAMVVVGSLRERSITRVALRELAGHLAQAGCGVDWVDLAQIALPVFNPDTGRAWPGFAELQARVQRADGYVLGNPDYHGSISGALKNFLDHFWHEFAGKLFGTVVASHEKGLTAADHLRTVIRQCYGWVLPYGVSLMEESDVREGRVANPKLASRLAMFARDFRVYGGLLARQRHADLAGTDPGFLARCRTG